MTSLDSRIKIGNSSYSLSEVAQAHLRRYSTSDYRSSRSVVIIQEPHNNPKAHFNLFKGLEIFFRDNPSLVKRTVFLAEGHPANEPVSVQSLITEEPNPTDNLIREVLGSFLITGYMAYEWKHQRGIPIVGTEDEGLYQMCSHFLVRITDDSDAIFSDQMYVNKETREPLKLPLSLAWDFSIVLRNKSMAKTLIENTRKYENPILFVGGGHMGRWDEDDVFEFLKESMTDASYMGVQGILRFPINTFPGNYPLYRAVREDAENLGIHQYLERARIGYTFLNPVGIIDEKTSERDTDAYDALFKAQDPLQRGGYSKYIEQFLEKRDSSSHRTTVRSSPAAAAELVKRLKEHGSQSIPKSETVFQTDSKETPHEFEISRDELISRAELHATLGRGTLWGAPPTLRGRLYEQLRHANIAGNYPKIDDANTYAVTSMKTLDLTSYGYQDVTVLGSTVKGYIDDLSTVSGAGDKYLEIGIPAGRASPGQLDKLHELQGYANSLGVTLVIAQIP